MAATYPTGVKSFSALNPGDTVQDTDQEQAYDEITAIETDLLAAWTTPSFSAGNFTGNGAMTWTLGAGDVTTFAYKKDGKRLTIAFWLVTTTVGGTPDNELRITIPGGFTAAKNMLAPIVVNDNNGGNRVGYAYVAASGTTIGIRRDNDTTWTASTNLTSVYGEIVIETTT